MRGRTCSWSSCCRDDHQLALWQAGLLERHDRRDRLGQRRTFYRHFPDKRETLFDGEAAFQATLLEAIAAAQAEAAPMRVLVTAFGAIEPLLAQNRGFATLRQQVIAATPALRERELSKAARIIDALARALAQRGVDPGLAPLAAQAGMLAFDHAVKRWSADPDSPLSAHLAQAFADLHSLSAG